MNEPTEVPTGEPVPALRTGTEFRTLRPDHIVNTIESVLDRIEARFPGSGIGRVCCELLEVGNQAEAFTISLRRPIFAIRVFSWLLIAGLVALAFAPFFLVDVSLGLSNLGELMQAIEATLNEVVLIGLAILFLVTWERRTTPSRTP